MKQYLDLLQNIIDNGVEKESGRANMPNTIGISKADIRMDLKDGFPLLTTKKMYWKGIVHELLWFLTGDTNIKYLVDNNVNIWNGDAYRWYLKHREIGIEIYDRIYTGKHKDIGFDYLEPYTIEEFVNFIKTNPKVITLSSFNNSTNYILGDLGKVYGYQWRNQNGVDQVKDVIEGLKNNPYSRYHIIDGWQKSDFPEMALPPCHLLYQFIVRPLSLEERVNIAFDRNIISFEDYKNLIGCEEAEKTYSSRILDESYNIPKFYLDLNMYQRSVDSALGNPYNIASMSLLLMIFSKASNMIAGIANWIGGDTHLYVTHVETAKEQLKRTPFPLPTMKINKELNNLEDILNLSINDFEINNYIYHPTITYELFVGLKK